MLPIGQAAGDPGVNPIDVPTQGDPGLHERNQPTISSHIAPVLDHRHDDGRVQITGEDLTQGVLQQVTLMVGLPGCLPLLRTDSRSGAA